MLNKKEIIIFNLICAVLLLPLLYFPLSPDLGVFLTSVRKMDAGGVPYIDIFDIKAPLVFYFFQFITKVFGTAEWSIRLFDFIVQMLTVNFAYHIINKLTKSRINSIASGIIYILTYVTMNFNNTSQIESFAGLFFLCGIYIHLISKNRLLDFGFGLLLGLLTGMKYTLGMFLAVILFDDIFRNKLILKDIIKKYSLIFGGFIISFGLGLIPYLNPQVYSGFKEMSNYLSFYASMPSLNGESLKYALKALADYFGDTNSIFIWTLFIFGLYGLLKNKDNKLTYFSFLLFVGYFITVCIERKFFQYHLSRLDIFISIIAGGGFAYLVDYIKSLRPLNFEAKTVLFSITVFILLLSPLPRYFQTASYVYYYYMDREAYVSKFQISGNQIMLRRDYEIVANYINSRIQANDKVLNATTGSNVLTYLINTSNMSKFCQSSYYVFPKALPKHIDVFSEEIKNAKYLIIQTNDRHLFINGYNESTYDRINQIPKIKNTIDEYMTLDTVFVPFKIYKHK